jgi:hypothetical protein
MSDQNEVNHCLCMGVRALIGCLVCPNNYFLHLQIVLLCSFPTPQFLLRILLLHPMTLPAVRCL